MIMPKGRQTIRKGASALADGPSMRLWDIESAPGSTLEKLEASSTSSLRHLSKRLVSRASRNSARTAARLLENLSGIATTAVAAGPWPRQRRLRTPSTSSQPRNQQRKLTMTKIDIPLVPVPPPAGQPPTPKIAVLDSPRVPTDVGHLTGDKTADAAILQTAAAAHALGPNMQGPGNWRRR
jgi:hypothetical protein